MLSKNPAHEIDERLSHISQNSPALASFIKHIENSVVAKPHVLVAYAWVLYMALFSGGRYLRASLQNAGTDFWLRSQQQSLSAAQPPRDVIDPFPTEQDTSLSDMRAITPHHLKRLTSESKSCAPEKEITQTLHRFFHFPGAEDGEDIKKEFKERVAEIDTLLSDGEKDEIVKEAQHIFNFMVEIVGDLDMVCNTNIDQRKEKSTDGPAIMSVEGGDGVSAIAREWLSSANLTLRPNKQDARILSVEAASRMVNLGMGILWQCISSLFMGRAFNDQ